MAAKKIKRTITLWQSQLPADDRLIYRVVSLQNALEPPIGALLTPEEIADMIVAGWTVNVKETK